MRKALVLGLCLSLVGCVVGPDGDGDGTGNGDGTGGGGGGGGGSGSGSGNGISGNISQSTELSGPDVLITGITTIDPGVTVTIAAGTTITLTGVASINVGGVLDVQGTSAAKVTIKAEMAGFNGISVSPGGELKYSHVVQTGGGIFTNGTGKATIVDTHMSRTSGDFLMMNGGALDVSYSSIGLEPGETDTTHCNMHFGGAGNSIKVTHSNISTSSYGLMFYGGMAADFQYNNWFSNTVDVDTTATSPVTGNFSFGWFEKGAPTGTGLTANNLAGARLVACDGQNDAQCSGIRAAGAL